MCRRDAARRGIEVATHILGMKRSRKREHGQALVTMVLWLTGAFFALTVVGIDLGHLGTSATELQTVADIAASAGARNLLKGGSTNTAKTEAISVVAKNKVDGQLFTMAAADVHVGTYTNGVFNETSINPSAVRATPSVTVNNVVAGLIGMRTATIQKEAIAAFQGISKAQPTLPVVLGECLFPEIEDCFSDSCMPSDTAFPKDTEPRTAWTTFNGGNATGDITQWLSAACGGGGKTPPTYAVGDTVSVVTGSHGSAIHDMVCMFNSGQRQYLIPIVKCNGNSLTTTVTGFATFVMDSAQDNKGVDWHTISMQIDDTPLAGGCAKCGSGKMALVK